MRIAFDKPEKDLSIEQKIHKSNIIGKIFRGVVEIVRHFELTLHASERQPLGTIDRSKWNHFHHRLIVIVRMTSSPLITSENTLEICVAAS